MRRRHRAVALERAHVLERGAELLAPAHRVALVADMAFIEKLGRLGNESLQHFLAAAVAVAGEDQRLAANVLGLAVGARHAHATDAAVGVGIEVRRMRGGGERDFLALHRREQRRVQLGAVEGLRRVHVRPAVAGILEVEDAGKRHLLPLDQPLDRVLRLVGDQPRDGVVAFAVRLRQDVLVEKVGRVVEESCRALQLGARCGDLSARERGAAGGLGVALDDEHLRAVLLRRQRGDGAAGAGADDEDLGLRRELPAFGLKNRHFYFDIRLGSQVIISGKIT